MGHGGIGKLSLLLLLALWAKPYAVPWREKNAFKVATSLPARLVDSIMAQGNWNILFQAGPFSEFQRQIAIGNHFALRGELRQADFYFQKAGSALDIAYASLRGRFSWPRNPSELKAANLPWGEDRDTFEDFLLCRLQLQIESMLAAHASGTLKPGNFETLLVETEKQLVSPIAQKDAALDQMIHLLREALSLRGQKAVHAAILADRFAVVSDKVQTTTRNYWNRRSNIFRILENIHYGNSQRALFLMRYTEEHQKDQIDSLSLARLYIQTGGWDEARRLLTAPLSENKNKTAENYTEYLSHSAMLQNLLIWLGQPGEAEKISNETRLFISELIRSENVPRDEILDLKKRLTNEILRGKMSTFVNSGKCPDLSSLTGDTDMETEWRVRERIFFERCKLPYDANYWKALLKNTSSNPEMIAIATAHLGEARLKLTGDKKPTPVTRYLSADAALRQVLIKNPKGKLVEILIQYLKTRNAIHPDFVLFDWGIDLRDDLTDRALDALPQYLTEKDAQELFSELNRRHAYTLFRGQANYFFASADQAIFSHKAASILLDAPVDSMTLPSPYTGGIKKLLYADARQILFFDAAPKKPQLKRFKITGSDNAFASIFSNTTGGFLLYGAAISEMRPRSEAGARIAPLFSYCAECGQGSEKKPERLVVMTGRDRRRPAFTSDLADNFSVITDTGTPSNCPTGVTQYDDSVMLTSESLDGGQIPCNFSPEKIIIEYEKFSSATSLKIAVALGWRRNLTLLLIPQNLSEPTKTSFLFDFFQRTNRRQVRPADAFRDAKARAEKSFPAETSLSGLLIYESLP